MGTAKRDGALAIVRASSASDKPTTGLRYPLCGSGGITEEPKIAKIPSGLTPDTLEQMHGGNTESWEIADINPTFEEFGYLMACHMGKDTWGTSQHLLEMAAASQYVNVQDDDKLEKGSSTPTRRLFGGKIESLELDAKPGDYMTMKIGGPGCDVDLAAALTESLATGTRMSWAHVTDANAYIKIGFGTTATADTEIQSIKFSSKRTQTPFGIDIGHKQPQGFHDGEREITIEFTKEFSSVAAKNAYLASIVGTQLQIEIKFYAGASIFATSNVIYGRLVGNVPGPLGAENESITCTLSVRVEKQNTITWTIKDGVSAAAYF